MVVARAVLPCEERLTGILRPEQSCLHMLSGLERVAQPVLVAIAEIAAQVAVPLVEGDMSGGGEFALPVPQQLAYP